MTVEAVGRWGPGSNGAGEEAADVSNGTVRWVISTSAMLPMLLNFVLCRSPNVMMVLGGSTIRIGAHLVQVEVLVGARRSAALIGGEQIGRQWRTSKPRRR